MSISERLTNGAASSRVPRAWATVALESAVASTTAANGLAILEPSLRFKTLDVDLFIEVLLVSFLQTARRYVPPPT
jgi:hypothetical protein